MSTITSSPPTILVSEDGPVPIQVSDGKFLSMLRKTNDLFIKHSISGLVNWETFTLAGKEAIVAETYDFRKNCVDVKTFRAAFAHINKTQIIKHAVRKLADIQRVVQAMPNKKLLLAQWYLTQCTLNAPATSTSMTYPKPTTKPLENLPTALQHQIHTLALGWWIRRTIRVQGIGYYLKHAWCNQVDPITFDDVHTELPTLYLMTYLQKHKTGFRVFAFDIRSLYTLFKKKSFINPFDNISPFSSNFILQVKARCDHFKAKQIPLDGEITLPVKNAKDRVIELCNEMQRLNYYINVEWLFHMTIEQLAKWYLRCEDIWVYRAQLTTTQQFEIAPGNSNVFPARNEIRNKTCWNETMHLVCDSMHRLVATAERDESRVVGIFYVLSALTECCAPVKETYPYLYQPTE